MNGMEMWKPILLLLVGLFLVPFLVYIAARAWWDGYFNARRDYFKKGGGKNDKG